MFVPNFEILGAVVPEKSLTEKNKFLHIHTDRHINIVAEKTKTLYSLYTSYAGRYNKRISIFLSPK